MERSISAILVLLAIFRVRLRSHFFPPFFNEKLFSTLWIYILIRIFSNIHYVTLHSDIIVRFHLISCSFTCFKYAVLAESSVRLKSVLFLRFRKLIFYLPSCWITVHGWTMAGWGALLDSRCYANAYSTETVWLPLIRRFRSNVAHISIWSMDDSRAWCHHTMVILWWAWRNCLAGRKASMLIRWSLQRLKHIRFVCRLQ